MSSHVVLPALQAQAFGTQKYCRTQYIKYRLYRKDHVARTSISGLVPYATAALAQLQAT